MSYYNFGVDPESLPNMAELERQQAAEAAAAAKPSSTLWLALGGLAVLAFTLVGKGKSGKKRR